MKEIPLTRGYITLVDDADYEWLSQWKWCAQSSKYRNTEHVYATRTAKSIKMHRVIMNAPDGMQVDHRDGNTLNNQRSNLRLATALQNSHNKKLQQMTNKSSGYKGVSWDKQNKKWQVKIRVLRRLIHIGLFTSELDAAKAYDVAARQYFGEFAKPNFPDA